MRLPTVAIDREGVKVIINESDYIPGLDKLWSDGKPKAEPKAVDEPTKDKDWYITELAKHGIERDRRSNMGTLKALLAEAEKSQ